MRNQTYAFWSVLIFSSIIPFLHLPAAYSIDNVIMALEHSYDNNDSNWLVFPAHETDKRGQPDTDSRSVNQSLETNIPNDSSVRQQTQKNSNNSAEIANDVPQPPEDSVTGFPSVQNSTFFDDNPTTEEIIPQNRNSENFPIISSDWFFSESGFLGRDGIVPSLKTVLVMSVVAIAPAILLMTTSYVRISIVLFLLRQALGLGQIPSNQIIATLAVFLTALVMSPVAIEVYEEAIIPYSESQISRSEAFQKGQEPVRTFLWKQIERTGNTRMISLFTKYLSDVDEPKYFEDVPWRALAPAFLLSELKTSFLIGFQMFLPFLVIDFVVSCVLVSTGMMMLPPTIISLPLKLALFVMIDGWALVVRSLVESFA